MEWNGMEKEEMKWNGMEWTGKERKGTGGREGRKEGREIDLRRVRPNFEK
jgi:hypothetical protein